MPSALRILAPLWCPLSPTFRLPDAPLTTPGYRSQTPRPCPAACSCPHPSPARRGTGRVRVGEVTGPRAKAGPRASPGSGVVSRRQFPPSFPEPHNPGDTHSPTHSEMTVADFLCWAFPVSPWPPGSPSASPWSGWGGCGGRRPLCACVDVLTCVSQDSRCHGLPRLPAQIPVLLCLLTRTWGWAVTSASLRVQRVLTATDPPQSVISRWQLHLPFLVLGQNPWRLLPEGIWL